MREGEYEYIHEFRKHIAEIMNLQKRYHAILDSPTEPTTVKQASLTELHRLNITLSKYFDVASSIINNNAISLPTTSETKPAAPEQQLIV